MNREESNAKLKPINRVGIPGNKQSKTNEANEDGDK